MSRKNIFNEQPAKYSLLIPAETDRAIREICKRGGGLMTPSEFVRQACGEAAARLLGRPEGEQVYSATLSLNLADDLARGLGQAATALHTSVPNLVERLLLDHLPGVLQEARERRASLGKLLDQKKQQPRKSKS